MVTEEFYDGEYGMQGYDGVSGRTCLKCGSISNKRVYDSAVTTKPGGNFTGINSRISSCG